MLRFLLPHSRSFKCTSFHSAYNPGYHPGDNKAEGWSQQKLILKSKVPEAAVLEKMEMTKLEFKKHVHFYSTTLTAKTIPKSFKQLMVRALNSRTKCLPNYQRLVTVFEDANKGNKGFVAAQDDFNFGVGYYPPTPHHLKHSDYDFSLPQSAFMLFYNEEVAERVLKNLMNSKNKSKSEIIPSLDDVTKTQANKMFLAAVELYKNKDHNGKTKDFQLQKEIDICREVWSQLKREYVIEMKEAKLKQREKDYKKPTSEVDIWFEKKKLKLDKEFEKYYLTTLAGDKTPARFVRAAEPCTGPGAMQKGRIYKKWRTEKYEKLSDNVKTHYGKLYMIELKNYEFFLEANKETRSYLNNTPIEKINRFNMFKSNFLATVDEPKFSSVGDRATYLKGINSEISLAFKQLKNKEDLASLDRDIEVHYKLMQDNRKIKLESMDHHINQVTRTQVQTVNQQNGPQSVRNNSHGVSTTARLSGQKKY